MSNEIDSIIIIPAKFATNDGDNHRMIDCYVGDDKEGKPIVERRRFEKYSTEGIDDPTYLLLGIIQGPNYTRINFADAKDFEDMFIEKWSCLT